MLPLFTAILTSPPEVIYLSLFVSSPITTFESLLFTVSPLVFVKPANLIPSLPLFSMYVLDELLILPVEVRLTPPFPVFTIFKEFGVFFA